MYAWPNASVYFLFACFSIDIEVDKDRDAIIDRQMEINE